MKIVIIGAGLIGCERIESIKNYIYKIDHYKSDVSIIMVVDTNADQLAKVEKKYNVPITTDIAMAMKLKPDWVFICTPNDITYSVAKLAYAADANVLAEKPLGRTLEECNNIIALKPEHLKLQVGFNYRFFDGIEAALNDAKLDKFGKLISVNFILAHGNAPGMEKSWHLNPVKRGSVVADLGVHLFDLILQLSTGKVSMDYAKTWSGVWNTGIKEEAHMLLSDESGTIFNAQVSFNRWRSNFRMEINGTEGYGVVEGRGRSYGPQSYKTGVKWGWQAGKSQAETENLVIDKNDCSNSFIKETFAVLALNKSKTSIPCDYNEAKNVMSLLEQYNKI